MARSAGAATGDNAMSPFEGPAVRQRSWSIEKIDRDGAGTRTRSSHENDKPSSCFESRLVLWGCCRLYASSREKILTAVARPGPLIEPPDDAPRTTRIVCASMHVVRMVDSKLIQSYDLVK